MAGYHRGVYRKQGGDELVVASSGAITVESGGRINYSSGGYATIPVQALLVADIATNIINHGITEVTGTTTGPTYTLAAPVAGATKYIALTAASSAVTNRARINSNTTGVSFDTTGGNQLTLATSAMRAVSLFGISATKWRISGVNSGASVAAPRTT